MLVSKKSVLLLLSVLFTPIMASAVDQATAYQDAANFATANPKNPAADPSNTANLPQYSPNPPQANYYGNSGAMQTDGATQMTTDPNGKWFTDSSVQRPRFTIDPNTDPTILKAKDTAANADLIVGTYSGCSQLPNTTPGATNNTTCQEYRPDEFYTCNKTLNTTATSVTRLEYYPSKCVSNTVWCTTSWWCDTPTQAMSLGYYWTFINGTPVGQVTSITSCSVACDWAEFNGWEFGRAQSIAFCDLNNCGTIVKGTSSEGLPTYTCTGAVGSSTSGSANCPAGFSKTVEPDGKVICRQIREFPYSSSFTAIGSVSFTVPDGVTTLFVSMAGGGGGGGGGNNWGAWGSGGGGGGGYMQYAMTVTPGQVITGTVGAGGPAGGYSSSGSNGQATTFGSLAATGGQGGQYQCCGGTGGAPGGQPGSTGNAGGPGGDAGAGQGTGGPSGGPGGNYGGGGGGGYQSSYPPPREGAQGWVKVEWGSSCSKDYEIPQTSLTPGVKVFWEIWSCDSWVDGCTVYETRAP